MIRRPPRSTQSRSSAASDVYKRQLLFWWAVDLLILWLIRLTEWTVTREFRTEEIFLSKRFSIFLKSSSVACTWRTSVPDSYWKKKNVFTKWSWMQISADLSPLNMSAKFSLYGNHFWEYTSSKSVGRRAEHSIRKAYVSQYWLINSYTSNWIELKNFI